MKIRRFLQRIREACLAWLCTDPHGDWSPAVLRALNSARVRTGQRSVQASAKFRDRIALGEP